MRLPDLDRILSAMLETHPTASPTSTFPSAIRCRWKTFGELKPVFDRAADRCAHPLSDRSKSRSTLMQGDRRLMYDYLTGGSCDCSYSLGDEARFRVNIFRQRGNFAIVLRKLRSQRSHARDP